MTQVKERGGTWDQSTVLAVYEHWLHRRKQAGGPLLATIWFQQPWKVRGYIFVGWAGQVLRRGHSSNIVSTTSLDNPLV